PSVLLSETFPRSLFSQPSPPVTSTNFSTRGVLCFPPSELRNSTRPFAPLQSGALEVMKSFGGKINKGNAPG
ncbi:mCG144900, partial [Mus musculus]